MVTALVIIACVGLAALATVGLIASTQLPEVKPAEQAARAA